MDNSVKYKHSDLYVATIRSQHKGANGSYASDDRYCSAEPKPSSVSMWHLWLEEAVVDEYLQRQPEGREEREWGRVEREEGGRRKEERYLVAEGVGIPRARGRHKTTPDP